MTSPTFGVVGAPADATGTYPQVAGYVPMDTGRRVGVYLVDVLIVMAFYAVAMGAMALLGPKNQAASIVVLVIYLILLGLELWALFAKSARLSGVLMKATYVDVHSGRPSGGKLFGKFLLQGLISTVTLGIGPLIMVFTTVMEPLKRNWFDRKVGLMLVDHRTGRQPGQPAPELPAPAIKPAVNQVQFPAVSVEAGGSSPFGAQPWAPAPPASTPPLSHTLPQPPSQVFPQAAAPAFPQAPAFSAGSAPSFPSAPVPSFPPAPTPGFPPAQSFPMPAAGLPQSPPATVKPIVETGGFITGTPTGGQPEPAPSVAPYAPPPVVVRDMRSVDASIADRTELASDLGLPASSGPRAVLDDGSSVSLNPPTVLGRNPSAPGSHPDAVPRAVDDRLASKTHLIVGSDAGGAWVIDLHSTNGVQVTKAGGSQRIEAGRKIQLPPGAKVAFGQRSITVS